MDDDITQRLIVMAIAELMMLPSSCLPSAVRPIHCESELPQFNFDSRSRVPLFFVLFCFVLLDP